MHTPTPSSQEVSERELRGWVDNARIVIMIPGDVGSRRWHATYDRWRAEWAKKIALVAPSPRTRLTQVAGGVAWVQSAERLSDLDVGHFGIKPAVQVVAVTCRDFQDVWIFATEWVLRQLLPHLLPSASPADLDRYVQELATPARALTINQGTVDETAT
jgi:hypothetical protein